MKEVQQTRWSDVLKRVTGIKGADINHMHEEVFPHVLVEDLTSFEHQFLKRERIGAVGARLAASVGNLSFIGCDLLTAGVQATAAVFLDRMTLSNPGAATIEVQVGFYTVLAGAAVTVSNRDGRAAGTPFQASGRTLQQAATNLGTSRPYQIALAAGETLPLPLGIVLNFGRGFAVETIVANLPISASFDIRERFFEETER